MSEDRADEFYAPGAIARIKRHLRENKKTYLIGVGCLGAGYLLGSRSDVQQIIKTKNVMRLCYKSSQVANTIVLQPNGDPGNVVQNLRTLETYSSQGELARALGLPAARVSDYFHDRLSHLQGDQFAIIGKAGHPIAV
jgi:hypothetical protein